MEISTGVNQRFGIFEDSSGSFVGFFVPCLHRLGIGSNGIELDGNVDEILGWKRIDKVRDCFVSFVCLVIHLFIFGLFLLMLVTRARR